MRTQSLKACLCRLSFLLLAACATACASGNSAAPPPDAARPAGLESFLPKPSELRAANFVDVDRELLGSYSTNIGGGSDHTSLNGDNLDFSPVWGGAPIPTLYDAAYRRFEFHLDDYDGAAELDLNWLTPPATANLWVGAANFTTNRWDWVKGPNVNVIALPDAAADYIKSDGYAYIVILLLGSAPAELISARFGPELWVRETVEATADDLGKYTGLALDSLDHPHISYYNATDGDLRYAYNDGTGWVTEPVDTSPSYVGQSTSIAIGPDDKPHIAYFDLWGGDLLYASKDGGVWTIEPIEDANTAGQGPSLRFNSLGVPYVSYYDSTLASIRLAHFDGLAWQKETVIACAGLSYSTSLIFDASDKPCIAYATGANVVRYAYHDGVAWEDSEVYSAGTASVDTARSLALDPGGRPAIAIYEQTALKPAFAHFNGATWDVDVLDNGGSAKGAYNSILYDTLGQPNIFFYGTSLERRYFDGSRWWISTISESAWTGHHVCPALDSQGKIHISYYSAADHCLRYARQL